MRKKKLKLSEELLALSISACTEAVEWVQKQERRGFDDNAIWKMCVRGDWMAWWLLEVFVLADRSYFSAETTVLGRSLYAVLGEANSINRGPQELASAAHLIREYFPEWPL